MTSRVCCRSHVCCADVFNSATVIPKGKSVLRTLVTTALLLAIAGCASPPKISATMDISRRDPDTVLISLRVTNLEDHATTPIAPEVMVQTHSGGAWEKAVSQIHPVAFVLNKHELRNIVKVVHTNADVVRAMLTIKEQENGHVLMNQRIEKAVP